MKPIRSPILRGLGAGVGVTGGKFCKKLRDLGVDATIGGANLTLDELCNHIDDAKTKKKGRGKLGVNLMVFDRQFEDLVQLCDEKIVDYIVMSAGIDMNLIDKINEYKKIKANIIPKLSTPIDIIKLAFNPNVKEIHVEGGEAVGYLDVTNSQQLKSTEEIINDSFKGIVGKIYMKETKGAEIDEAYIQKIIDNYPIYQRKYKIAKLIACGVPEKDYKSILQNGADGIGIALEFIVTKEGTPHDDWKKMQVKANDTILFRSPIKNILGQALLNDYIRNYFELKAGVYVPKEKFNYEGTKFCEKMCMQPDFCEKSNAVNKANMDYSFCLRQALVDTAINGYVNYGIVFSSENVKYINKIPWLKSVVNRKLQLLKSLK